MASASTAITSEHSVNSNLAILMVRSVRYLLRRRHHPRLQALSAGLRASHYPRKVLTAGGALLDGMAEDVLQGLVNDDNGNQILVRVDIVVVRGIGHNLFSVMASAKKGIMIIFDYENPRLEGFNVTVPLRSESGDLYSLVLDLSADRYGAKELAMNAVANAQVWHRRLDRLHAQSLGILRKRDDTGITFERAVSDCDVCAVGNAQQLVHPKTANRKVKRPFQLGDGNLMGLFTPVAIGGYKYVGK